MASVHPQEGVGRLRRAGRRPAASARPRGAAEVLSPGARDDVRQLRRLHREARQESQRWEDYRKHSLQRTYFEVLCNENIGAFKKILF